MTKGPDNPFITRITYAEITHRDAPPVLKSGPLPVAAPGQVLVRMRAATLNFADLLMVKGQYQDTPPYPFVPGLEGAGEVLTAPDGSGLYAGQRIAVNAQGALAQVVAVDPVFVTPIPPTMSFAQAAGFQVAYGTSHLALDHLARLQPGQTLAVTGAAGGVGLTAVEIGAAMGARVIAIARGADKLAVAQAAGATQLLDADAPDPRQALRDLGGVDVVYDAVGGALGEAAFRALRPGGRFLLIGFASGQVPTLPLNHALVKNISVHGLYWGGYRQLAPQLLHDSMTQLMAMFDAGRLSPTTGHELPLDSLTQGYDLLRNRKSVGKVVITL